MRAISNITLSETQRAQEDGEEVIKLKRNMLFKEYNLKQNKNI